MLGLSPVLWHCLWLLYFCVGGLVHTADLRFSGLGGRSRFSAVLHRLEDTGSVGFCSCVAGGTRCAIYLFAYRYVSERFMRFLLHLRAAPARCGSTVLAPLSPPTVRLAHPFMHAHGLPTRVAYRGDSARCCNAAVLQARTAHRGVDLPLAAHFMVAHLAAARTRLGCGGFAALSPTLSAFAGRVLAGRAAHHGLFPAR